MNAESLQFLEIASRGKAPAVFDKVVDQSIRVAEEEEGQALLMIRKTQNEFLALVESPRPNVHFEQLELDKRYIEKLSHEQKEMQINFENHFEEFKKGSERLTLLSRKINQLTDSMGKIPGQLDSLPITLSEFMAKGMK